MRPYIYLITGELASAWILIGGGAYCDKEIKVDNTAQSIDLVLLPDASIYEIRGEMLGQTRYANPIVKYIFNLGRISLICNDLTQTINLRTSTESKKEQNTKEL